jgi:PST family polysaccharide transporter
VTGALLSRVAIASSYTRVVVDPFAPTSRGSGSAALLRRARKALRHPIAQNAMALYAVQFVLTILPLITLPWLARVLGPAELGVVIFVQSFSFLLGMLIEFGFQLSATRRIAAQRGDRRAMGETVAGVLGAKLGLMAIAAAVSVVVLLAVPAFRNDPKLLAFGLAMALLQGLLPIWFFTGLEQMKLMAGIDVTIRLITAAAIIALVREEGQGVRVLWIWTIGAAVSVVILNALMYRRVPFMRPTSELRSIALKEGWALFIATAAVSLYTSGTVFMLGLVVSSAQLALFSAAERVVRAAIRATGPISGAAYPRINHLLSEGRADRAQRLSALVLLAVTALAALASALIVVLAPVVIHLLFGDQFDESVGILRVLALLLPPVAIGGTLSGLWLITRRLDRISTTIAVSAGLINLVATPLVGSLSGPLGVAWTLVAIETGAAVALVIVIRARSLMPTRAQVLGR